MIFMTEPRIIKETSSGTSFSEIRDEMFSDREILCVGEINSVTVNSLINQIRYLAKSDPEKEIMMYINSPGGEVSSGLALYDVMKAVKCPIRTVCVGTAASMAAVLFASGSERDMLPHARIMIHDPLIIGGAAGSALVMKRLSDDLLRTREIMCGILAEHTGRTLEEIYEKTASDSFFYADEAIKFGLADKVVESL